MKGTCQEAHAFKLFSTKIENAANEALKNEQFQHSPGDSHLKVKDKPKRTILWVQWNLSLKFAKCKRQNAIRHLMG